MNEVTDKKSSQSSPSFFQAGLLEVVFIVLLVGIIILTLNYFNIIPLSSTFSSLSFLPQQGQVRTQRNTTRSSIVIPSLKSRTRTVQYIISLNNPKKFVNNSSEYEHNSISESTLKVRGEIRLDLEIAVKPSEEDASQSSGFQFTNELANKENSIALYLYYLPAARSWGIQYKHGEKAQLFPLFSVPSGKIYGKFSLIVSADGKSVTTILPTGESKTLQLPESIYTVTNQMQSAIAVAPNTEVEVISLSYQY